MNERNLLILTLFIAGCSQAGIEQEYKKAFIEGIRLQEKTLDDLKKRSREKNPSIEKYKKMYEKEIAKLPQSYSLPDPVLSLGIPERSSSVADKTLVQITQQVPFPTKLITRHKMQKETARSKGFNYLGQMNHIMHLVEKKYLQYSVTYKLIEINERQKRLVEQILELAKEKYKNTEAELTDIVRAEIRMVHLQHRSIVLEKEKKVHESELSELLGGEYDIQGLKPFEFSYPTKNYSMDQFKSIAVNTNPRLLAVRSKMDSVKEELKLARQSYIPDLVFGYTRDPMFGMVDYAVTVGISVPLQFYKNNSKIDSAAAELERVKEEYLQEYLNVIGRIEREFAQYREFLHVVTLYRDVIIPKAEQNYELAVEAYKNGKISLLDVIDAETEVEKANDDYLEAMANSYIGLANLKELVGTYLMEVKDEN